MQEALLDPSVMPGGSVSKFVLARQRCPLHQPRPHPETRLSRHDAPDVHHSSVRIVLTSSPLPSSSPGQPRTASRGVPPQRDPAPRQRGLQKRLSRLQTGLVNRPTLSKRPRTLRPKLLLLHLTRFAATDAPQGLKRRQQQIESQLPGRRASAGGSTADRAL